MNDLQKDRAIYKAMCEIAEKYFNNAIENSKMFRNFMAKKSVLSVSELNKCDEWKLVSNNEFQWDYETIEIGTFSCSFYASALFDRLLLETFRKLAKESKPYVFKYEEKIDNKRIGTLSVSLDNPSDAKVLTKHLSDVDLRKIMSYILVDVNAKTGDINFVASNGASLSIITNNKKSWELSDEENSDIIQALFSANDWKRICDYAKKSKSSIKFEVYRRKENEAQDTFVAILGDTRIRSAIDYFQYPKWRKVLPKEEMRSFAIHPDDVKKAQTWVEKLKCWKDDDIYVSCYEGSNLIYFDYESYDDTAKSASFRLTTTSGITIGTAYKHKDLKKIKFTAFSMPKDHARANIISDQLTDLTILMPAYIEGSDYLHDRENREVPAEEFAVA